MRIKNKLICGVGINDADYVVIPTINGKRKRCPYYSVWTDMLYRCYSEGAQEKYPTYKGCSVCDEWLIFSVFKSWMEAQDWKGRQLDKDILVEGNKIYSPESCVFVDADTNLLLNLNGKNRGEYPLGVDFKQGKFRAVCKDYIGKSKHLGYFSDKLEARHSYLKFKSLVVERFAYRQHDERAKDALLRRSQAMKKVVLEGCEYIS